MDRYRGAIRADLAEVYGVDLAEWWAQGRWAGLLELIDGLPSASRTTQAQLMDEENAERLATMTEGAKWAPALSQWTTEAELLAQIRDLIPDVVRAILASIPRAKGKPAPKYPVEAFPRPRTALDVIEDKRREAAAEHLLAALGMTP